MIISRRSIVSLISEICDKCFEYEEKEEKDSPEYDKQSEKCQRIYDELYENLNEEQKKTLLKLDWEHFMLSGQWKTDGFNEGAEKGFKLAVRLLFDSLKE